uniref:WD-40 repeat family n=1 Tax=Brachypodium distachyon TaxID=15368 RepID=C3SA93_BRADI|nr:WD-40 repeat family [Brachypodium distachyon]
MAHDLQDDLELAGDYDFEFADAGSDGLQTSGGAPNMDMQMDDTSAVEYRQGKDMQGIPWERLNYTRDQYRQMRLKQYKNYESLNRPRDGLHKLRNLLWATSKHDVYVMQNYSVMHWSSLLRRGKEVLNVAGQVAPTQDVRGARPLSRVQISTMAVKDNLVAAGGFHGELICKHVDQPGVAFCTNLTGNKNSITNAVDIYRSPNGATRVMAANNDCVVRAFDTEKFSLLTQFPFPWSVNNTSVSPDGKALAVLGDSSDCLIADSQSGKEIATLRGHLDYSFSSAWHPDGRVLATGNQDRTCRLWDVRNTSQSLAVLQGRIGSIRGLEFSPDGRFLAAAEPADFVHVCDVSAGYARAQEIGIFGEIAGVSFSPDDGAQALFVGVADRTYGGLLEFRRRRTHGYYLDCYL